MRKIGGRLRFHLAWDGLTQLLVLCTCFAAGIVGGFLFSCWGRDDTELLECLSSYFEAAGRGAGTQPSLWLSVWDLIRWPLAAFLLGSTALGVVGVPVLLGIRGFLLSFAAATFVRMFGLSGLAASLTIFGVTALVAVPVLFVIASDAFRLALRRLSGERVPVWGLRTQTLALCAGILVLAVALQQTLMPALLAAVCTRLFLP